MNSRAARELSLIFATLALSAPRDCAPAQRSESSDPTFAVVRATLLVMGLAILVYKINEPFSGWFEWNSAWYAHFARNHLQYGLEYTQLYCTDGLSALPPETPVRYVNHPPLLCGLVAAPMWLLGDHAWVARGVPIAATLGSAWLLMSIVARLYSGALSLLTGFFFLALPLTAYFGRMLDFTAVVQFFSLAMLHGYLDWSGAYGNAGGSRRGIALYCAGAVLAIATDWAGVLMASPICAWHLFRHRDPRIAAWVWLAPAIAGIAALLHIVAAVDWDTRYLVDLLATRTVGMRPEGAQPWSQWVWLQWGFLRANYTLPGIAAAVAIPVLLRTREWPPASALFAALRRTSTLPWACVVFQGVSYVVLFKNQSWIHDYWQYYLAPYVAVSLAAAVAAIRAFVHSRAPAVATVASVVAVAALLPGFYTSWSRYHSLEHIPREYLDVYVELAERIPAKKPVMTSRNWQVHRLAFGRYDRLYVQPQIAYHANRPLVYTRDAETIVANESGSAAYVLEKKRGTNWRPLAELLQANYETFEVGELHIVALLDPPS